VPFAFPSHQGLILPVWVKWPDRFNALALSVGAAAPDIVDGLAWPLRGRLGQWLGHSLVGLVPLCLPVGLLITILLRAVGRRQSPDSQLRRLDNPGILQRGRAGEITRLSVSVFVGAASHIITDFVTHANLVLLLPFYEQKDFFPSFWCHTWASVPLLVYKDTYPIAPHTIAWFVLSIAGAVMYVRILKRTR